MSDLTPGKTKIAVLGGGCGSLAAVWGLLQSQQAHTYDITVYQLGFRLGGKGASGRNQEIANRIEEHGLHIWGGCYENAFQIMQQVYGQINRPAGTPLSVWYDPKRPEDSAFLPHSFVTLAEYWDGAWSHWNVAVPLTSELPGQSAVLPNVASYLEALVQLQVELLFGPHALERGVGRAVASTVVGIASPLADTLTRVVPPLLEGASRAVHVASLHSKTANHFRGLLKALRALPEDVVAHSPELYRAIKNPAIALIEIFQALRGSPMENFMDLRRATMVVELGLTVVIGVLDDRVLVRGFDAVDDIDFTAWLLGHGCSRTTAEGFMVSAWYDFFFAYAAGDTSRPSLAASTALRTIFRYIFTYKGAFFWKMQAGMGDIVFAPLYLALKERGVKFEFFQQVEELCIENNGGLGDRVESIKMARQVDLAHPEREYDPLIQVHDVACWPSKPQYDQIDAKQAEELKRRDINLESYWTSWEPVKRYELLADKDFDLVILGISVGALQTLTPQLCTKSPRWKLMVENLATNQTVAAQLWFKSTQAELGWLAPNTVGTANARPLNTWANMDHLLPRETWETMPGPAPKSLVYYCGTLTDALVLAPASDDGFRREQRARALGVCVTWLDNNTANILPRAVLPGTPMLDYSHLKLHTEDHLRKGEARFSTQYYCANISPSDRYVLALPGTAQYRIRSDQSGFSNLYCAGDWLATGMNAGCVEGAVMGGLQASQAISGFPSTILGDFDKAGGFFPGLRGETR